MNLSNYSRGEQVLESLAEKRIRSDGWMKTEELMTKEVGGSNGLVRLRELRQYGWNIQRISPNEFNEMYNVHNDTDSHYYRIRSTWIAVEALWIMAIEDTRKRYKYLTKANDFSILDEEITNEKNKRKFDYQYRKWNGLYYTLQGQKKRLNDDYVTRRNVLIATGLDPLVCAYFEYEKMKNKYAK